jgi:hypothetical protein
VAFDLVKLEPDTYNMDLNTPSLSANQKRKAEHELSTNPHTVKARKRLEALQNDKISLQIEKAKAADQGAITYAKKKLVQSAQYQAAEKNKQDEMIKQSATEVLMKRYVTNLHFTNLYTNR